MTAVINEGSFNSSARHVWKHVASFASLIYLAAIEVSQRCKADSCIVFFPSIELTQFNPFILLGLQSLTDTALSRDSQNMYIYICIYIYKCIYIYIYVYIYII